MSYPTFAGNRHGRRNARNKSQNRSWDISFDQADLERTAYVGRIEPDNGSSQERCAANEASILVFGIFLDDFEETFGVHHDGGVWGVETDVPIVFISHRGCGASTEKAENSRDADHVIGRLRREPRSVRFKSTEC